MQSRDPPRRRGRRCVRSGTGRRRLAPGLRLQPAPGTIVRFFAWQCRTEEQLALGEDGPVGWVLLSREAVARADEALDPDARGVRDEVGFLALHQGFADRFFPGTSVLHTRLRYVLFVPWLLDTVAERGGTDFAERFSVAETALAGQLNRQKKPEGVIGGRVWPDPAVQPPSMAYWTALGTWRILRARPDGSAPSRAETLRRMANRPARRGRATDDEDAALEEDGGSTFVKLPPRPKGVGTSDGSVSFELETLEREFLRRHLLGLRRHGSKELSLLARIVDARIGRDEAVPWARAIREVADEEDSAALVLARRASALAGIGRAVYAALLENAHKEDGLSESTAHRERLAVLVETEGGDARSLDLGALNDLLTGLPAGLRGVLANTRAWLTSGRKEPDLLYEEYAAAEWDRKRDRARLPRTVGGRKRRAEWDPGEHPDAERLHYRWQNVRRLLRDLYGE